MATVAQIQANRLNAQKSTGPRTAAGKERASRNAIKHGLLAREAVIAGEDPEEFEIYREGMLEELGPAGQVETLLAERVVSLSWRLRRAERLQNAAFAALDEEARHEEWKQLKGSEWERGLAGVIEENVLGQVVVEDFGGARVLDRLLMYERRIESSLYRTMAELRREREARQASEARGEQQEASPSQDDPAAVQEPATPTELASFGAEPGAEEASSATCRVSSDGCGRDAAADSTDFCPGGSDKRSLRSLSMAPSQEQDHRQTSVSMPPGVEESRSDFPLQTRAAVVRNEPNSRG